MLYLLISIVLSLISSDIYSHALSKTNSALARPLPLPHGVPRPESSPASTFSCDSAPLMSDPYPSFAPTNAFSKLAEQSCPVRKLTLVIATGDQYLCGGFNNDVLKQAESHISEIKAKVSTVSEGLREKSSNHHDRNWERDRNRDEFMISIPSPLPLYFRCPFHSDPAMPTSLPEYGVLLFHAPELPKYEVDRTNDQTAWSRPHVAHCSRLQIHQNHTRNESSTRCLVIDVNPLQLQIEHTDVPPCGIDSILVTCHLSKLRSDLVFALSSLHMMDFSHLPTLFNCSSDSASSQWMTFEKLRRHLSILFHRIECPNISLWNAILQGALSGIGTETACMLTLRGVHVILGIRNVSADNNVKEMILKEIPFAKVDALELDLCSMASVSKIAADFNSLNLPLNILINNAGVGMSSFMLSPDGIEN